MRVRFVLLAVALLLVGGAAYLWNKGVWTEAGQAATSDRYAYTSIGKTLPPGAVRGASSDDRSGSPGVVRVVTTPVRKGDENCVVWHGSGRGEIDADNWWCPVYYNNQKGWANAFYLLYPKSGRRQACILKPDSNGCRAPQSFDNRYGGMGYGGN
jgi:hypothetical protein